MAIRCPKCHFDNPSDTRFCGNCAAPLHPMEIGGHEPNSPEFGVVSPDFKTETMQAPIKEINTGSTFAGRYQVIEELGKDGNARIMDFGIARSLRAKSLTGEGMIIGTPEYMSPEQVEGKEADQRSDIYSLGTILYEMLTGRVPFEGDTPLSVAIKQKAEKPQEPKELNEQIPGDLNRLILRCLEKDRERRYQSAEERAKPKTY